MSNSSSSGAATAVTLTGGAIRTMYGMDSSMDDELFVPVVQVLRLKRLEDADGRKKWAVVLSDGRHFLHGECDPDLNEMVADHVVAQNAVIRVRQFSMSARADRKVCYLSEAREAAPNPGSPLGTPVDVRLHSQDSTEAGSSSGGSSAGSSSSGSAIAVPKSDGFFSLRSRPVWHDKHRDALARRGMVGLIERTLTEFECLQLQQRTLSAEYQAQLKALSKESEHKLYQQARSFADYVDQNTFQDRLSRLATGDHGRQQEAYLQHHHRLHLLRHAIRCEDPQCSLTPFCKDIKDVWEHMQTCKLAESQDFGCPVPFCYTMKRVMFHSKFCRDGECQICEPTVRIAGCVFCKEEEVQELSRLHGGTRRSSGVPSPAVQTKLGQDYILTMNHASMCPFEEDGECTASPLCFDLKKVCVHRIYCTSEEDCQYPFCKTSRDYGNHFNSCWSDTCQVCPPVRATRNKFGISKLSVDPQDNETARPQAAAQIPPSAAGAKLDQQTPAKIGDDSSGPDVVASQVAIYEEIQRRYKRASPDHSPVQSAPTPKEAMGTEGTAGVRPNGSGSSAGSSSVSSIEDLQIREYERLRRAHQQRQSSTTSPSVSTTNSREAVDDADGSPEPVEETADSNMDTKPAALPEGKDEDKPAPLRGGTNYFATTYQTRKNTKSVVCTQCSVSLFIPELGRSFSCQECSSISYLEDGPNDAPVPMH